MTKNLAVALRSDLINRSVRAYEGYLNLNLGYNNYHNIHKFNSDFAPFGRFSFHPPNLKSHRERDIVMEECILKVFPEFKNGFCLVNPNIDSIVHDYAKNWIDEESLKDLDYKFAEQAVKYCIEFIRPAVRNKCGLITYDDAVSHLDWSTSPGFPFTRKFVKKKLCIEQMHDLRATTLDLLNGLRTFWALNDKEELRPREKLLQDNTRTFKSGPINLNILGLMCLKTFQDLLCIGWQVCPIKLGMCIYNGNWSTMVNCLRFLLTLCDAPKWDARYVKFLAVWVMKVFKYFLKEECWPLLEVLFRETFSHLVVLPDGTTMWQEHTMASGAPFTSLWNSIGRMFQFMYVIAKTSYEKRGKFFSTDEIKDNLDLIIVGDDVVFGTTEEFREYLNLRIFNKIFYDVGWHNYAEPKKENVLPQELIFCSHKTLLRYGVCLPMREDYNKVICSLIYSAIEPPVGWSLPAYRLQRFWNIVNMMWPDEEFWVKLNIVGDLYTAHFQKRMQHNADWVQALGNRKGDLELSEFFMLPHGVKFH